MWLIRPAILLRKLGSPLLAPFQSTSRPTLSIARTDISFPLAASGRHRSGGWERLAVTETGVVTVVSRYQVATPSRTITARATGLLHIAALHPNAHRLSCHKTMVYNAASFDKLFQDSQKVLRGGPS